MLYSPPPPFDKIYANNPYAGEIAYVDRNLERLFEYLKQAGLYDELTIVLVGDHGEGLGDHVERTHGMFLYEECVRVPLIVKLPQSAGIEPGKVIQQSASLLDVVPTLIQLHGLGPVETDGISLAPWLLSEEPIQERETCLETQYPLIYNWSPLFAYRDSNWKYIHAPRPELYNLQADPHERENLYETDSPLVETFSAALEDRLLQLNEAAAPNEAGDTVSMERAEMLGSLGYVSGGSSSSGAVTQSDLPDPKDKIEIAHKIDVGLAAVAHQNPERAIELFLEVAQEDPDNPTPYYNLGLVYTQKEEWDQAVQYTEQALALAPESLLIQLRLASVLISKGERNRGRKILRSVLETYPKHAEAHAQLGRADLLDEHYADALKHFQNAKKWMPDILGIDDYISQAENGAR